MMQSVLERTPTRTRNAGTTTTTRPPKTRKASAAPAAEVREPKVMHRKGSLRGRVTDPQNLAERLIARRQDLDLSQEAVAEQITFWNARQHETKVLSRSAYCMYESGEVTPDLGKIMTLAKVLKCTPQWLAFGIGEEPAATDNLIEEVSWNARNSRFEQKQTWAFDAEWTLGRFESAPSDLALTMVNDFAPSVKPGDMAIVRREVSPNASGGEFAFVQDDEIKIAHVTRPTAKGAFRVYDADKRNHVEVDADNLTFLGKVMGRIGDI
jgi:transcriptional regulator with XRE-family HTH domain